MVGCWYSHLIKLNGDKDNRTSISAQMAHFDFTASWLVDTNHEIETSLIESLYKQT